MKSLLDVGWFHRVSAGSDVDRPPKLVEAARCPYGPFKFKITMPANFEFAVEVSTNQETWTTLSHGQADSPAEPEFVDSDAANFSYRFYRVEAAGVLSENIIGYVTTTLPPGFSIVTNPLHSPDASIPALFRGMPEKTIVTHFDARRMALVESAFEHGSWSHPSLTLSPGDAAIVFNPSDDYKSLSFVGDAPQGNFSIPVPAGFSLRGAPLLQPGRLDTDLGFPISEGDVIHLFDRDKQKYMQYPFDNGEWTSGAPVLGVAEGFWAAKKQARNWITNSKFDTRLALVEA